MNNKPIAWACWNEGMPSAIITFAEPDKYGWQSIKPLYTTPLTKPLTEDEIRQIYKDYWLEEHGQIVDFVKAIEERHGVK